MLKNCCIKSCWKKLYVKVASIVKVVLTFNSYAENIIHQLSKKSYTK